MFPLHLQDVAAGTGKVSPWKNNNDSKLETILVGDDLGICHMYTFDKKYPEWHICNFKIEE